MELDDNLTLFISEVGKGEVGLASVDVGVIDRMVGLGIDVAGLPSSVLNTLLFIGAIGVLGYIVYRGVKEFLLIIEERHLSNTNRITKLEEINTMTKVEKNTCLAELRLTNDELKNTNRKFEDCMKRLLESKDG